ncbi:hypothetical protein JCM8097_005507 [Rhodosporidiobolus ruineniae]
MTARTTPVQLEQLAGFSVCELADALAKLGGGVGHYLPDLERFSGDADKTVVGEVFTVEMVDGRDTEAPKLSGNYVDHAEPGSIVFISTPPDVKSASLGGLLATALKHKDVKGLVSSGRVRDLAELRALDFPTWARGHSILGQSPWTRVSRVQVPVVYPFSAPSPSGPSPASASSPSNSPPPATINPYDLIACDVDGVLVFPPRVVGKVIELAKKGKEVDERCRADLLEGKGVAETFKKYRGK